MDMGYIKRLYRKDNIMEDKLEDRKEQNKEEVKKQELEIKRSEERR